MISRYKPRFPAAMPSKYNHIYLLLYWVFFGIAFYLAERLRPVAACQLVYHPVDDVIPFVEWFFIPYLFWFVFLIGIHIYLFFADRQAFQRMMCFIALTYSVALVTFIFFPTYQNLRPYIFPRDNFLTRVAIAFYRIDTNTNVCPSLHVVGSFAVCFAAWDAKGLQTRLWKGMFFAVAVLISISTVFVKQHSVIDVAAGLALSALGYLIVYILPRRKGRIIHETNQQLSDSGGNGPETLSELRPE